MADESENSQPRQPHNLQGLLRYAVEAAKTEDESSSSTNFQPLDEERKRFLEDALKSMTVDVIELMHKNITILREAGTTSVDSDIEEYLNAIEAIVDHVDRIDVAIDFHKIGGFTVFAPCLNSVHSPIRAAACDLLAELVQNNVYCQTVVLETDLLSQLITLLDKDPDEKVQIKALYAISCTIRENRTALTDFIGRGGISVLHRALQRPIDRLRTKAAFLLSCLCTNECSFIEELLQANIVPLLVSILAQDRTPSHEHILQLLHELAMKNEQAAIQCADSCLSLRQILADHLEKANNRPEFEEETIYCHELMQLIEKMPESSTDTDR